MKKVAFLIVIYLAFGWQTFSQDSSEVVTESPKKLKLKGVLLGVQGNYAINSTALTNELYNAFLWGKHIDVDLKNRIDQNLKKDNLFGLDLNYELFCYTISPITKHSKLNYYFKFANKQHIDASFSRDFFNVAFNGNAGYAGNTAFLGKSQFQLLTYQQATVGVYKPRMSLGISLLNGLSHLRGKLNRADLYTSPTGEFLDLDLDMELAVSDTSKNSRTPSRGIGVSTELQSTLIKKFQINLGSKSDSTKSDLGFWGVVNFEITDLGFIRWNENTINYQSDTSFHFEGIVLNNLLSVTDSTINQIQDSLNNTYSPNSAKQPYIGVLPAFFHLYTQLYNETGTYLTMGTKLRLMANYKPFVYLSFQKNIKGMQTIDITTKSNLLFISSTLSYGGYGNLNWGTAFTSISKNNLHFSIGIQNLLGFILPKSTFGSGLYIKFAKQL